MLNRLNVILLVMWVSFTRCIQQYELICTKRRSEVGISDMQKWTEEVFKQDFIPLFVFLYSCIYFVAVPEAVLTNVQFDLCKYIVL